MSEETVRVALGARSYDILIGHGLLGEIGAHVAERLPKARVAVVTDDNVEGLHLATAMESLTGAGLDPTPIVIAAGEGSKNFTALESVVGKILDARLERGDAVLALGGGVIGDLAGFAAAICRRGMRLVQAPTSLLAQVDSSVGGKTGINAPQGKNLVGAFHQPTLVIADVDALDTLPPREFAAGYAEVVKYGLIDDRPFFEALERQRAEIFDGGPARMQAIAHSCRAKARIVAADETETGERALLNLGHTFAHALEAACRYDSRRLVHGEAVAIGMALAHRFSVALGLCPQADADRVSGHLEAAGLPTQIAAIKGAPIGAAEMMHHMAQDKKVSRGRLTFILSRGIGEAFIAHDVQPGRVQDFLATETGGQA